MRRPAQARARQGAPRRGPAVAFPSGLISSDIHAHSRKQRCPSSGAQARFCKVQRTLRGWRAHIQAGPGTVWEERNGYVYINGKKLNEPYIRPERRDHLTLSLIDLPPNGTQTRIPKDYYLVMGDNRRLSCDSRRWGLVPRKNLIGEVFATYWPVDRVSHALWVAALAIAALLAAASLLVRLRSKRTS
jgi:hypothetical protein